MDTQFATLNKSDRATVIKWLWTVSAVFVGTVIVYLALHAFANGRIGYGWESVALDKERIQTLNAILLVPTNNAETALTPKGDETKKQPSGETEAESVSATGAPSSFLAPSDETIKVAQQYILNELGEVDPTQLTNVVGLLKQLPAQAGVAYLLAQKFRVKSFFWLTGSQAYWEIIFWSIFGVLASTLFIVSSSLRTHNDNQDVFDISDIPYQWMKLFYAPICILILIFGYNLISDDSLVGLNAGKGMLIFAFITGFYSGRMMTLLNRLKEVILPGDSPKSTSSGGSTNQPAMASDLVVTVALDPANMAPDVHADIKANDLGKTVVKLMNKTGTVLTTLERTGAAQDGKFIARQVPDGTYKLDAHLSTEGGSFTFDGESDLVVSSDSKSRSANLTLGLSQTVG